MNDIEFDKLKKLANKGLYEVGDALKQFRTQKGWTMSELARNAHVSSSVISDLENHRGVMPNVFTLLTIAKALELPENALLDVLVNKTFNTTKDSDTAKISRITQLMIDYGLPAVCVERVIDYMNHYVMMANIYDKLRLIRLIYNTEKSNGTPDSHICISRDMLTFIDQNTYEIGKYLNSK